MREILNKQIKDVEDRKDKPSEKLEFEKWEYGGE